MLNFRRILVFLFSISIFSCNSIPEAHKELLISKENASIRGFNTFKKLYNGFRSTTVQASRPQNSVNKKSQYILLEQGGKQTKNTFGFVRKYKYTNSQITLGFGSEDSSHPMCRENELEQALYQKHIDLVHNPTIIKASKELKNYNPHDAIKMHYQSFGKKGNQAIILVHGLLGDSDYFVPVAKKLAKNNFMVYVPDQRNHGKSPHSEVWDYESTSNDLLEFVKSHNIENPILIGHSIGGKIVMDFHARHPELSKKLVLLDIVPKTYPNHFHSKILKCLNDIDLSIFRSEQEIFNFFDSYFEKPIVRDFYLERLIVNWNNDLEWRMNLKTITEWIPKIREDIYPNMETEAETLFIRGGKSDYVLDEDILKIKKRFPNAEIKTYEDSGHWLHQQESERFFKDLMDFL